MELTKVQQDKLMAAVMAGKTVTLCEYRGSKAELKTWRDAESGRSMSAVAISHYLETTTGEQQRISERPPEGQTVEAYVPKHKRGSVGYVDARVKSDLKGAITYYGEFVAI